MTKTERADLEALLAQTEALRDRFEATQPGSQRLAILIKDVVRLKRLLAA